MEIETDVYDYFIKNRSPLLINKDLITKNSGLLERNRPHNEFMLTDYLKPKNSSTLFNMFFTYDIQYHMEAY
jgi:hypothetical protein